MEKLNVESMHNLIILLQHCPKIEAQIHLSNLGCVKYNFPHFYKKQSDGWWQIQASAFNLHINHQEPMIPLSSDWHQRDPTFRMFRDMLLVREFG